MNKGRIFTSFLFYFFIAMILMIAGCTETYPPYIISGTVTDFVGTPVSGVTINLTGTANGSTTTDANGKYNFINMDNGTYTVTPSKGIDYKFNPTSRAVSISGASVTADFTAKYSGAPTYNISGTVTLGGPTGQPVSGVTMTLYDSGGTTIIGQAMTDQNGNYTLQGTSGSYRVTPSATGYTFTPSYIDPVNVLGNDVSGQNFLATAVSISGTVSGDVAANVTINLTGVTIASTQTGANGDYAFNTLPNGGYTVTPSLAGYKFSPTSTTVTITGGSAANVDFTSSSASSSHSISGKVTVFGIGSNLSGVTLTFTDSTGANVIGTTSTGLDGTYTLSGFSNGSYRVIPSIAGYTFDNAYLSPTVSGVDSTGNDFIATPNYTQDDLNVTWVLHSLAVNTGINKWQYATATVNSAGNVAFSACNDSAGNTTCPASDTWTITPTGEISSVNYGSNIMTMTSNKNFIAGALDSSNPTLQIFQKTGASYSSDDVQNITSFVFHELSAGNVTEWRYGAGNTDSSGAITITSEFKPFTMPSGTTPGAIGANISIDGSGFVTMDGTMSSFNGFMSDDKKTIVGTYTPSDGNYRLMIIQITTRNDYTAVPDGTWFAHLVYDGTAALWANYTFTVNSGTMTIIKWMDSNGGSLTGATLISSTTPTGTVTLTGYDFNGQLSDDGKFMIATETFSSTYALVVTTQ